MSDQSIVIVSGVRTPMGGFQGSLSSISAVDLGAISIREAVSRAGIPAEAVEEVIMGCVGQPADVANVTRVIALRSGIPEHVPAITVHRNCASGFESVTVAHQKMCAGKGEI